MKMFDQFMLHIPVCFCGLAGHPGFYCLGNEAECFLSSLAVYPLLLFGFSYYTRRRLRCACTALFILVIK